MAIDISKYRHEVLIAEPGKKRRRRLTIQNKREDFDRLIALLMGYGRSFRIGFEATDVLPKNWTIYGWNFLI